MRGVKIDFDAAKPIYQQIMDGLCRAVARGELRPGDKVPSQRDMALTLRVNPNTVQRAYREMEREGLLETARGWGTFITRDRSLLEGIRRRLAEEAVTAFVDELEALGLEREEMMELLRSRLESERRIRDDHGAEGEETPGP